MCSLFSLYEVIKRLKEAHQGPLNRDFVHNPVTECQDSECRNLKDHSSGIALTQHLFFGGAKVTPSLVCEKNTVLAV